MPAGHGVQGKLLGVICKKQHNYLRAKGTVLLSLRRALAVLLLSFRVASTMYKILP